MQGAGRRVCFTQGNRQRQRRVPVEKSTNAMEKASCAMEDAAPMGEGISRRSFLGLGALGAAGLAALGLAGCAPQANNAVQAGSADVAAEAPTAEELPAADTEESCDVVVVGLGTSGWWRPLPRLRRARRSSALIARPPWAPRMPRWCLACGPWNPAPSFSTTTT